MRVDQVKVSTVKTGESFRNFETRKGILDVADRGYSNPPSIEAAVMQHGDVLVRWNFASLPLWSRDCRTSLDVRHVTRGLEAGQRRELQVAIHRPGKHTIPGRLLVERLPDAEAEKARQRARAEDSGPLGIEMAPYVMLFTTVPEDRLSAAQLFELYRLRWQVELELKREKSIAGLDLLPSFVEKTIQAWLLAKLLLNQIARRLYDRAQPAASAAAQCPESGASLPVTMSWYAAVTATVLLRAGLLSFRLQHLDLVARKSSICLRAFLPRVRRRESWAPRRAQPSGGRRVLEGVDLKTAKSGSVPGRGQSALAGLALRAATGGGFVRIPEWIGSSLLNSLAAAVMAATLITGIGAVLGWALARARFGARVTDALMALSFVMPAAVLGVGLIVVWNHRSTGFLYSSPAILVISYVARYSVIGARPVAAAVAQTSMCFEEAAAAFGAGFLRRLGRIVLPLHRRAIASAWLLALVFCLRDLEMAVLNYPPGGETLPVRIFTLEANGPEPVVAALSLLHICVTAAVLGAGAMLLRRRA